MLDVGCLKFDIMRRMVDVGSWLCEVGSCMLDGVYVQLYAGSLMFEVGCWALDCRS